MDNKVLLALIVVVGAFIFLNRKKTVVVGGGAYGPTSAAAVAYTPTKPAIPQPSTGQVALAAGIQAAPQIISALGSFFSDNNDVDTSDDFEDYN
jgi:hypothetical protein